jgi:hypothetical protein
MIITNVRDFGWHAINVIEDDDHPPWTYTIGFYETWGFPELIILGRSRATAPHPSWRQRRQAAKLRLP